MMSLLEDSTTIQSIPDVVSEGSPEDSVVAICGLAAMMILSMISLPVL